MKENDNISSLLSYLGPHQGNFHLHLSIIEQPERSVYPFLIINNSDPLARLIEARVVSDAYSGVKKLFLLVQRDKYLLKKDETLPLNNRDVFDLWQKAFSFYAREKQDNSFILLSGQLGGKGELSPLSSLFYCRTKKVYFHPPCPKCGLPLRQCEDDDLLVTSGLQPFSGSLKRYLFCASCGPSGSFYIDELEQSDSPAVKDRRALIKEFGLLREAQHNAAAFPCADCQLYPECYGAENKVVSRIVPFSFYPFYMLAFEAMSLSGLDFISLISGATFEEAEALLESKGESGRINYLKAVRQNSAMNTPFLFDHDDRCFLEVLYLKLSFLGEALQSLQSSDGPFIHPDFRPTIDGVWVKLGERGLLPFFWNFNVKFMGLSSQPPVSQQFSKSQSNALFFMGLVWFYTLLTNRKQNMPEIHGTLEKLLSGETASPEKFKSNKVFDPSNIFWNPDGKTVNSNWKSLWEKSLNLGFALLNTNKAWDGEGFKKEMETLRNEIKENLFLKEIPYSTPALPIVEKVIHPVEEIASQPAKEDEAVHAILMGILKRWQPAVAVKKEEAQDTVILSTADLNVKTAPVNADEIVSETVILSSQQIQKEIPPVKEPPNEELQETMILSLKDLQQKQPQPQVREKDEEDIEKTVIMSLKGMPVPQVKEPEKPEEAPKKKKTDEDFLAETIILKPGEKTKDGPKKQ